MRIKLRFDGFLFQIASVQFDWVFVLVVTNQCFALLNNFFNFGTIFAFWQFLNSNILLEVSLFIDEANFAKETFAEFLKNNQILNNKFKGNVVTLSYLCFWIFHGVFGVGTKFLDIFRGHSRFNSTILGYFLGVLFLFICHSLQLKVKKSFNHKTWSQTTLECGSLFLYH